MEVKEEKVKTVTAHLIASELPRVEPLGGNGFEPNSTNRPSEPPSAAWAGLEGWQLEGRLSNDKLDDSTPKEEPAAIKIRTIHKRDNFGPAEPHFNNGQPVHSTLSSRKNSRVRHGYDYHQDKKK